VKQGDDATSTELVPEEQFKDFVRRIISVPKKEIDRKLEAQRRHRKAERDRRK
jgi:hypothetical protein